MEQVTVIGNIGRDAELKEHNGKQFVSFSIAANKKYTNAQGERVDRTNWYNCITRQTNLVQWLKKGTQVLVQGEPNSRMFKAQDGNWMISNNVNCDKIQLLSSGSSSNGAAGQQQQAQPQHQAQPAAASGSAASGGEGANDDLPF